MRHRIIWSNDVQKWQWLHPTGLRKSNGGNNKHLGFSYHYDRATSIDNLAARDSSLYKVEVKKSVQNP